MPIPRRLAVATAAMVNFFMGRPFVSQDARMMALILAIKVGNFGTLVVLDRSIVSNLHIDGSFCNPTLVFVCHSEWPHNQAGIEHTSNATCGDHSNRPRTSSGTLSQSW
jgi:hypothetical protein